MRRIPELDALRGIAALVVVVFHLRFVDRFPAMGTAVDLFFVLSGYLITTILLDQRGTPGLFRAFYARRALRIWPIYYLGLALCVLLNPVLRKPEPLAGFWDYFAYIQFVPGYWGGSTPAFSRLFSHSWTLAIEEQFYLLWPMAVVVLGRRGVRPVVALLLVTPVILRAIGLPRDMLLTRCDGLALGALLADVLRDRTWVEARSAALKRSFLAVGTLALLLRQLAGPLLPRLDGGPPGPWTLAAFSITTGATAWAYFGLAGWVLLASGSPRLAILRGPRLVHLGTISYGIYLYHPFVFALIPLALKAAGLKGSVGMDFAKVALVVLLAELSWRVIERPLLRLKDRFPYRPASPPLRGPHLAARSFSSEPSS